MKTIFLCNEKVGMLARTQFIEDFMANPLLIVEFQCDSGVTSRREGDPTQTLMPDGRWTFDPSKNQNYEKAFWLAWPQLAGGRNRRNLWNIFEAIFPITWDVRYKRQTRLM